MPSHPRSAWIHLGQLLTRRRIELDPRYSNRRVFAEERAGDKYRIVNDVELGKRENYEPGTLVALEAAYRLEPGAIDRFLAGGELKVLATAAPADTAVPSVPPPRREDVEWRGAGDPADLAPYIEDVRRQAHEVLVSLYGDNAPPPDDPRAEAAMSALPGAVIFPGDDDFARADATTWDKPALKLSEKLVVIALGHQLRDQADERENRRTGLIAGYGSITAGIPSWNVLARRP